MEAMKNEYSTQRKRKKHVAGGVWMTSWPRLREHQLCKLGAPGTGLIRLATQQGHRGVDGG
jgi:hypothetical protein